MTKIREPIDIQSEEWRDFKEWASKYYSDLIEIAYKACIDAEERLRRLAKEKNLEWLPSPRFLADHIALKLIENSPIRFIFDDYMSCRKGLEAAKAAQDPNIKIPKELQETIEKI